MGTQIKKFSIISFTSMCSLAMAMFFVYMTTSVLMACGGSEAAKNITCILQGGNSFPPAVWAVGAVLGGIMLFSLWLNARSRAQRSEESRIDEKLKAVHARYAGEEIA